ncbi:MAG: hypothetical protein ACO27A_07930, partial [Limnohabitans sp.]
PTPPLLAGFVVFASDTPPWSGLSAAWKIRSDTIRAMIRAPLSSHTDLASWLAGVVVRASILKTTTKG